MNGSKQHRPILSTESALAAGPTAALERSRPTPRKRVNLAAGSSRRRMRSWSSRHLRRDPRPYMMSYSTIGNK